MREKAILALREPGGRAGFPAACASGRAWSARAQGGRTLDMHRVTDRWRLGLALALCTTVLWSILPLALKVLLRSIDSFTITWVRLGLSGAVLAAVLAPGGLLSAKAGGLRPGRRAAGLIAIAAAGLCANYILYIMGLDRLTAGAAQVLIQLGPVFMMFGGVLIFRERIAPAQAAGAAVFVAGLLLFFNHRIEGILTSFTGYTAGMLLIIAAAITWAAYSMAQKQLLVSYSSASIMLVVYAVGAVAFLPLSKPADLLDLDALGAGLLLFCALNTLAAYGCFSEALNHWEASRVAAVLATVPVVTLFWQWAFSSLWPDLVDSEPVGFAGVAGAFMVVGGSLLVALWRGRRPAAPEPAAGGGSR